MTDKHVDKLVLIILAFHELHPSVPIDDIKALARVIGDITTEFALEVTQEQIRKIMKDYVIN
jgi:hypothetical protein